RRAEALHHLVAVYAADPRAPKRHGHTAQLNLTCDVATLQGNDTGRVPTLEGEPISLGRARLLACEAMVIPSVFDYTTGEAIELGRAKRLPNHALRRKLELEQPGGCAWSGCRAPIQWTEAHHIRHWVDGGATVAENLILLCRFHHGRIHTPGWTITKTGPGQALIVHHDGHADTDPELRCGCADWRTDTDLDHAFAGDVANVFPTGLYPDEWAETLKPDLAEAAEAIEQARIETEIRAAKGSLKNYVTLLLSARFDRVVPIPMPAMAFDGEFCQVFLGGTAAGRVVAFVEPGGHGQALCCRSRADPIEDELVVGQGLAAPVHGHEAEQAMLDLVPFRGAGRVVEHDDVHAQLFSQGRQFEFPQVGTVPVGASGVADQVERFEPGVEVGSFGVPPLPDRVGHELGGLV